MNALYNFVQKNDMFSFLGFPTNFMVVNPKDMYDVFFFYVEMLEIEQGAPYFSINKFNLKNLQGYSNPKHIWTNRKNFVLNEKDFFSSPEIIMKNYNLVYNKKYGIPASLNSYNHSMDMGFYRDCLCKYTTPFNGTFQMNENSNHNNHNLIPKIMLDQVKFKKFWSCLKTYCKEISKDVMNKIEYETEISDSCKLKIVSKICRSCRLEELNYSIEMLTHYLNNKSSIPIEWVLDKYYHNEQMEFEF